MTTINKGICDEAATVDELGITGYHSGLAEYIKNTDLPCTLSIQGDWGAGKTSVMKFIRNKLINDWMGADIENEKDEKVIEEKLLEAPIIEINTWTYSTWNDNTPLSKLFLLDIASQLNKKINSYNDVADDKILWNRIYEIVKSNAMDMFMSLTEEFKGRKPLLGLMNKASGTIKDELIGPSNQVLRLQNLMKKQIDNYLDCFNGTYNNGDNAKKLDRVVFLVDDLDRLKPEEALEFLESIKNIMNCNNAVFVLAIDFSVIKMGMSLKYNEMDEYKAKKFFEKIIQVPFELPKSNYNYDEFLKKKLGVKDDEVDNYLKLVDLCFDDNSCTPRAVIRSVNLFNLNKTILQNETDEDGKLIYDQLDKNKDKLIYFIVLIQMEREEFYLELCRALTTSSTTKINGIKFISSDGVDTSKNEILQNAYKYCDYNDELTFINDAKEIITNSNQQAVEVPTWYKRLTAIEYLLKECFNVDVDFIVELNEEIEQRVKSKLKGNSLSIYKIEDSKNDVNVRFTITDFGAVITFDCENLDKKAFEKDIDDEDHYFTLYLKKGQWRYIKINNIDDAEKLKPFIDRSIKESGIDLLKLNPTNYFEKIIEYNKGL